MSTNQALFPVAAMARVLGVSTAGYYSWRERPPSTHAQADTALLTRVRTIHATSRQLYGAPRVHAQLRADGERHGRKRIARLMRGAGLVGACHRGSGPTTTRRDQDARPAPDLVNRKFTAERPDQLWVADITFVPTAAGFLYLAVVLDACSRSIVGWSMANHLRTELVLDALEMAVGQRRPRNVIHHSDQGSQYTSLAFGGRCREVGVRPSMGSVGDAYDNAMCESFFSTLECELLSRRKFASQADAKIACFSYIEGFYNPVRLHSAIGYRSPICYEHHTAQEPAVIP
jgi:putative transposase